MRRLQLIVVLLAAALPSKLCAQGVLQTDWSGGGGLAGPVSQWEDRFDLTDGVAWRSIPGQLSLASNPVSPVEHAIGSGFSPNSLKACDLDGDGDLDVLAAALGNGRVHWWRNDGGDPIVWVEQSVSNSYPGVRSVYAADLDGDERLDVAATGFANSVVWWQNGGGDPIVWTQHVVEDDFSGGVEMVCRDMDGDEDMDILAAATYADAIAWFRNGGDGLSWTRHDVTVSFNGPVSVDAADLDGDGDQDVMGAAWEGHDITWWRNDGDGVTWTMQAIHPSYLGAHFVWAEDMDGDGDQDILACAYTARDVSWFRNEGGSPVAWTEILIHGNFLGAATVCAADFDGDGDADVLAAGQDPGDIAWWENVDGLGTDWTMHWLNGAYSGAWPTSFGDLDGDGDLDMLGGAYYAGQIRWWEATEFRGDGNLLSSILDTGADHATASLDWQASVPAGTELSLCYRSGDDPAELGDWSMPCTAPGSLAGGVARYLQYQLQLSSSDPDCSPILAELRFDWEATACPSDPDMAVERDLQLRAGRSLRGRSDLHFTVPRACFPRLVIVDAVGRRVRLLIGGDTLIPAGSHERHWDGRNDAGRRSPCGVYFASLEADGRRAVSKVCVLR